MVLLFALMLRCLSVIDHNLSRALGISEGIEWGIKLVLFVCMLLPFLWTPMHISLKNWFKPIWSNAFILIAFVLCFILCKIITGDTLGSYLSNVVKNLGGHYYTWYNYFPVVFFQLLAMLTGINAGHVRVKEPLDLDSN